MTATQDRPDVTDGPQREIGRDRRRKEDQRLITGRTRWTDNITLPGMLHLAMVRSPHAHASFSSIDTAEAKAAPNVVAVLTGNDLADTQGVIINAWPITEDQVSPTHLPMPLDRASFAGEIVAVVVARSAAEARDAAELVDVDLGAAAGRPRPQGVGGGHGARASGPRHQQVGVLDVRLGPGGHRRQRRRRDREGPRRRDRDRA